MENLKCVKFEPSTPKRRCTDDTPYTISSSVPTESFEDFMKRQYNAYTRYKTEVSQRDTEEVADYETQEGLQCVEFNNTNSADDNEIVISAHDGNENEESAQKKGRGNAFTDAYELLLELFKTKRVERMRVARILKMAIDQGVHIDPIIQKIAIQMRDRDVSFYTEAQHEKEFYESFSKYTSIFFYEIQSARNVFKAGQKTMEDDFSRHINELTPNVTNVKSKHEFKEQPPFKSYVITLDKLPTPRNNENSSIFLNKLIKELLRNACNPGNAIKKYTINSKLGGEDNGTYINLPETFVAVVLEFCEEYYGLRSKIITNRNLSTDELRGSGEYLILGDDNEEREYNLDKLRAVSKHFKKAVLAKIHANLCDLRRRDCTMKNGVNVWSNRMK